MSSNKLVIDMSDLAVSIDWGVANPEYVADKAEEFIEVLGVDSGMLWPRCNSLRIYFQFS